MTTLIYTHDDFGLHETPRGHVEQPARFAAVTQALSADGLADLPRREPPMVAADAVMRVHSDVQFHRIADAADRQSASGDIVALDPDTFLGEASFAAALRAAGAGVAAVDAVMAGEAANAFIAARPPGHHAEPDRPMGFCFFNSAAIAALHARATHGCQRIAVVDFDVHHGNGTQAAFEQDPDAFFASSHEWPQYPGTGRATDQGVADNIHNAPLATGTGSVDFRRAWGDRLLPALEDFDPDFVIISAGFDAHRADPLGGLGLTEDDFAWVTSQIMAVARDSCAGRTISFLEGGYDLTALGKSAAAHVAALAGVR